MTDRHISFVYDEESPQRLDKFLVNCLPQYTRSRLQNLIRSGHVLVNQKPAHKSGQELETGMIVDVFIPPPEPTNLVPEEIQLDIIFENGDVIVVNKPAGMVVHPAAGHHSGTLVHAALAHAPEMEGLAGEKRPGVVHRLDKNTSGLILLAKNDAAHYWLQEQFRRRKVNKVYWALVDGHPPTPSGRVEAAIGRDPRQRKRMAIVPEKKGRQAISEYYTIEQFQNHSLLEVHPLTGRTHQIRVHMAYLGCPIVGDTVYGHRRSSLAINRHFLHAFRLVILLPNEPTQRQFEAPLPSELMNLLESLRIST